MKLEWCSTALNRSGDDPALAEGNENGWTLTLMWIRAWLKRSTALSLTLCSRPLTSASRSNCIQHNGEHSYSTHNITYMYINIHVQYIRNLTAF